jgi:Holliday junction resolvase
VSVSSDKGVSLEKQVAKLLQKKLGARVSRDKRSGAGTHQKMDLNDYFQDTPLDIECKNHKTIKIREWWKQTVSGASFSRIPTLVFQADDEVLATVRFSDLVDLVAETQQHRTEIKRLKEPVLMTGSGTVVDPADIKPGAIRSTWSECRGGNMVSPGEKKCLVKNCTYCSNKKVKKEKK